MSLGIRKLTRVARYDRIKRRWREPNAVSVTEQERNIMAKTTWKPETQHGELSTKDKNDLPESIFAFPKQRKEPLTDAKHVRNALARFDQVKDVSDKDRDLAFENIKKAAKHYDVEVSEEKWQDLDKKPHTKNPSK